MTSPLPHFDSVQPWVQPRSKPLPVGNSAHRQHSDGYTVIPIPSLPELYQRLNTTPEQLAAFCQKWQIVKLSLFGSVLRDDFRGNGDHPSDIDLLYIHAPEARYGFQFFEMQEELERLFGRKVDLVSELGIQKSRNWLRRRSILESKQVIYVERSAGDP